MRFVDEAKIKIKAGDGGAGIVAWRREKFVPMGGPAGGNGGKGGDVIFVAKSGVSSLLDLKHVGIITAQDGGKGQSKNKTGRNGCDRVAFVPVGTILVMEKNSGTSTIDLTEDGQRVVVCKGGEGGFGNSHFKNPLCSAPQKCTEGEEGEECNIQLTLKLMADVGLLGFPNAGKSTLLTCLSNARPKVADYPFTTIKPMIGVCPLDIDRSFVMADIPGLVEGASNGAGLGFRFLRHLERVGVLCHIIDVTSPEDLVEKYEIINRELKNYSEKLYALTQVVALNKVDILQDEHKENFKKLTDYLTANSVEYFPISAVTSQGIHELSAKLYDEIKCNNQEKNPVNAPKVFNPALKLRG